MSTASTADFPQIIGTGLNVQCERFPDVFRAVLDLTLLEPPCGVPEGVDPVGQGFSNGLHISTVWRNKHRFRGSEHSFRGCRDLVEESLLAAQAQLYPSYKTR
jgi:hypothetical protein